MLKGVKLGGLVLDACSSSLRANNLVSSISSGAMSLPIGGPVIGWTAAGDSFSPELYSLLNRTETPFISSTSGTYAMDDPSTHFFRTVATDDSRTDALLGLVQYLGWKYVQVVYSGDSQGHNQFNMFRAKAVQEGICVLSSYQIGSPSAALDAVKGMLTSTSPVAVVLANQEATSELVTAKESLGFVARSIILLSSHRWGPVLLPETANRSIAVTPHIEEIKEFNDHMSSLSFNDMASAGNSWFSQYYESVLECDLETNNKYRRACVDMEDNPVTSGNR
jgi:metabotropic glutamate receptor 4/metabotropic glutamate receptor 6/7/8